jgi:hypothetical protein
MTRYLPVLILISACASTTSTIPREWARVPEATRIAVIGLDESGKVTSEALPKSEGSIRVEGGKIMNGDKALTEAFSAIDSFDFSASRGEVVFSARRTDNFDVGLVSSDGSPIVWIPSPDPADETAVQWAPRGNKISYIVRAKGGDLVRTVHIPTAFQLSTDFPGGTIRALAWDPQAEHYAVAYSTPEASDRVEVMKYDGSRRTMAVPPAATLDVEVEPFAKDAIVMRPRDIHYEEHLPLVVWLAKDFAWNDARAALMKNARLAMIVTTRPPDDDLWRTAKETAWIDASRAFVVAPPQEPATGNRQLLITTDATLPPNQFRRRANVVTVPPSVIQSFAAGFIADQLKRTTPAHGSSQ